MVYKPNLYADILSESKEVTGSCIKIIIPIPNGKKKTILLDKGLFQEKEYIYKNDETNYNFSDVDYVFLSHNHIDHSGLLPILYKYGYKKSIFCTEETSTILPLSLYNTALIFDIESKKNPQKRPLYTEKDVDYTLSKVIPLPYNVLIKIDENMSMMFIQNSHLYGAASIYFSIKSKGTDSKYINLLYVSDYNNKSLIFKPLPFPNWIYEKDITIIQESTYGSTKSCDIKKVLKENLSEACNKNMAILLPAFSIGRYQEIMYLVNLWKSEGLIPEDYPVFLDGTLPIAYNNILLNSPRLKDDVKEILRKYTFERVYSEYSTHRVRFSREYLLSHPKRSIVITTPGMISNGWAEEYVKNWISHENVLIHLLGYVAEETLGRKIIDANHDQLISFSDGLEVQKRAQVKTTSELSSHAPQDILLDYLSKFQNIKCHFTTHGSNENRQIFSEVVKDKINPKSALILKNDTIYRINGYGFEKELKSN